MYVCGLEYKNYIDVNKILILYVLYFIYLM